MFMKLNFLSVRVSVGSLVSMLSVGSIAAAASVGTGASFKGPVEFQPHGQGTLFDLLMTETNPKFVNYEMDIFWIVHPGQDAVKLLEKYPKRWELMHVKDMRKGTPTGLLTGHTEVTNDVAIGTGQIDIPAILRAAKKAGVKWYFIEDESPTSEKQLPQSLKYLEQVKF